MASKTVRRAAAAEAPAEPRYALAWVFLLYALAVLALMYPAFGDAFLANPSSDQLNGQAYRYFGAQFMRETGGFPLWNPLILGGLPFVAAQHGDIFYPTFLFRLAFDPASVVTWAFGVHLMLAGLFTYGFLRAWGIGFHGALIGGLAYMLGGKIASLVSPGHDGKMFVSALTPLVLWMIVRGMRDGATWAWGVLALATGLLIWTPHFQLTYYAGFLAIAFTLWLAFGKGDGALAPRDRWIRLGFAAGAGVLGVAVAAIHFLPFLEYIPYSPRGGDRGWEFATSYSMPPEELLNAYLPQFSGILQDYWGRGFFKLHGEYLGAVVLMLAGAAFGGERRKQFVRFWLVVFVVFTLWAFGGFTPFYRLVYLLPMMSKVRAPDMIFFIPTLACAMLAAVGTERLLLREKGEKYLIGWGIAALVIALLASVGVFTAIGRMFAPVERYDALEANASAVALGGWRSFLFVALAAGLLLAWLRGRVPVRVAGIGLALVLAVDNISVDSHYFRWLPSGEQVYAADPAIEYLQKLPEPGRVIVTPLAELESGWDPYLNGDGMMVHGVRTVTGHQGNELQRWVELAGGKSPALPQNIANPQFRRLANVRFWYTNADVPESTPQLPGMRLVKRVGPVRNSAGNTVFLYEFGDEENPAAWVAPVIAKAPAAAILNTVLDPRFDPRRAAVFDDSADVPAVAVQALPEPLMIRAHVTRPAADRISVTLDAPAPAGAALVVSENFYPGWRATVNGQPARIGRADYTFIGVALPEGAREVELSFHEQAFETGKLVTIVALILTALAIAAGLVADRRRRPGPVAATADA